MKKQLCIIAAAAALVGCVSESRTVTREVREPAGSKTVIIDDDKDAEVNVKADVDVPDVDVDVKTK